MTAVVTKPRPTDRAGERSLLPWVNGDYPDLSVPDQARYGHAKDTPRYSTDGVTRLPDHPVKKEK